MPNPSDQHDDNDPCDKFARRARALRAGWVDLPPPGKALIWVAVAGVSAPAICYAAVKLDIAPKELLKEVLARSV